MIQTVQPAESRPGRLRDLLPWSMKLRYLTWRTGWLGRKQSQFRLKTGERLILRTPPATDLQTAHEMFVGEAYLPPWPLDSTDVRRIVDLGSNVGYSVVYFCSQFPWARVEAYEPHPVHARYLREHVELNGLGDRVAVHEVAVAAVSGNLLLTDCGTHSQLVAISNEPTVRVAVIDWLDTARDQVIDLLKIDIEGGEFDLIDDPRFEKLKVRHLVIEWHTSGEASETETRVCRRLEALGFCTVPGSIAGELPGLKFGLVWGTRGDSHVKPDERKFEHGASET